jgi:hypothetical protein
MAHATAAAGEPKGRQRLYDSLWRLAEGTMNPWLVARAPSMDMLAQLLDWKITPTMAEGCGASLEDLTREDPVLAFPARTSNGSSSQAQLPCANTVAAP